MTATDIHYMLEAAGLHELSCAEIEERLGCVLPSSFDHFFDEKAATVQAKIAEYLQKKVCIRK